MRKLILLFFFICFAYAAQAQNISGKWYGYALQDTGELCQTCNFELDLSGKKNIWGTSHTYQKDTTDIRIGLYGFIDKQDSIRLEEGEQWVFNRKTLNKWSPCIRKFMLKYALIGTKEFLLGRGEAEGLSDQNERTGEPCIPALFVFARSKEDLNGYMALHKDSLTNTFVKSLERESDAPDVPLEPFTSIFKKTTLSKVTEITVNHTDIKLQLRDYLREDNDTVTIYLNRKLLASKKLISKAPLTIPFTIRKSDLNEILLYAENLGRIPPNTSEMYIIDGKKSYRIMIESDKQKTAAVYLRYKPE